MFNRIISTKKKGGIVMPGYLLHFAACRPTLLENDSFRKGVEAPDLLKKWACSLGLDKAREKYEEWKEDDMPDFSLLEERALAKDDDKGCGLHFGFSSRPDIQKFWSTWGEAEPKNPFWRGYLWHLITDSILYRWLDVGKKYAKNCSKHIIEEGMSKEEAIKIESKRLHDDWNRTNKKILDEFRFMIFLPPELEELDVVKFIEDKEPLAYVDWEKVQLAIRMLRLCDPINNSPDGLIVWGEMISGLNILS